MPWAVYRIAGVRLRASLRWGDGAAVIDQPLFWLSYDRS